MLRLEQYAVDDSFQPRVETSEARAEEYADLLAQKGFEFPPVDAFSMGGVPYYLGDGFTRHRAHVLAGRKVLNARVRPGGQREAMLFALGANATHGFPRSNEDKRRAVYTVLRDPEWSAWNGAEISRVCRVSEGMVRVLRAELAEVAKMSGASSHGTNMRTVRRGKQIYAMKPRSRAERSREDDLRAVLDAIAQNLNEAEALAAGLPEQAGALREALQWAQQRRIEAAEELLGEGKMIA
jgi:hypothetical protein